MSLDDKLNPDDATTLLKRDSWSAYGAKNFLEKSDSEPKEYAYSKWVPLQKDELYYVEPTLKQGKGWVNIDVGMEIKPESMPTGHPNLQTMA